MGILGSLIITFVILLLPQTAHAINNDVQTPGEEGFILNNLHIDATYDDVDSDSDSVFWAVRKDTCNDEKNTLSGNIGGHDNKYYWDGTTFSADVDVSSWDRGKYCFILNPEEDKGAVDVRLIRNFWLVDGYLYGEGSIVEASKKYTIEFTNHVAKASNKLIGDAKIRFVDVSVNILDNTEFVSSEITALDFYKGVKNTCSYTASFTAKGSWNNKDGYTLIYYAGDASKQDKKDTMRVTIYDSSDDIIYESSTIENLESKGHDFTSTSTCKDVYRTDLDNGNLTIDYKN